VGVREILGISIGVIACIIVSYILEHHPYLIPFVNVQVSNDGIRSNMRISAILVSWSIILFLIAVKVIKLLVGRLIMFVKYIKKRLMSNS